jgi:soluble lytic murein transglycosylase
MTLMVKHLISVAVFVIPAFALAQPVQQTPGNSPAPSSVSSPAQPIIFKTGTGQPAPMNGPVANIPKAMADPSEGNIPAALQRWRMLTSSGNYAFSEYASFLMAYPDWPKADELRKTAEQSINPLNYSPSQVVAFFDRLPPKTNTGHAKYAIALSAIGDKARAEEWARKAWRLGPMTDDDEARLIQIAGSKFTSSDYDERVEELLWAGGTRSATKYIGYTSAQRRPALAAWLATKTNSPDAASLVSQAENTGNAGLIAERANALKAAGNSFAARDLLANRLRLSAPPTSIDRWYKMLVGYATAAANDGSYEQAFKIASRVDDAVPPGMSIADQGLPIRDQYTNLTWIAGRIAMDKLGRYADAARMFRLYGEAAKSPQTRSKGLYWAGKAALKGNDSATAGQHFEAAAQYFDYFYGQLALEQLRRPLPIVPVQPALPQVATGNGAKSSFIAARITPKYGSWKEQSEFVRAISKSAQTPDEFLRAISLSQALGRPDLSVMAGRNARVTGYTNFVRYAFPTVNVPADQQANWTFIHAISRQESQFDKAIVSHAGAKGLMQLMPGTARETAGKIQMAYRPDALTTDPEYNIQLGSTYFQRVLSQFGGSYPLAVAAYNAGPGNVNKWLRLNGDPRSGSISMIDWIEAIPIFETRNYVQRVLENAVMYDHLNPQFGRKTGNLPLSYYLGKNTPG